jgi:hypothetical protein
MGTEWEIFLVLRGQSHHGAFKSRLDRSQQLGMGSTGLLRLLKARRGQRKGNGPTHREHSRKERSYDLECFGGQKSLEEEEAHKEAHKEIAPTPRVGLESRLGHLRDAGPRWLLIGMILKSRNDLVRTI